MRKVKKDIKILIFFLAVVVLAGIFSYFIFYYNAFLNIAPQPADAKISINGYPYSSGRIKLIPGQYQIKIEKEGFVPLERKLKLKRGDNLSIIISLKQVPQATLLSDKKISQLAADTERKNFYYLSDKIIFKATLTGDEKNPLQILPITSEIEGLQSVLFSPNFQLAIFRKQNNESGIFDFKRYDLLHQEYTSMGKDIGDVIWQTDGEKIFYFYAPADGERSLIRASKNNSDIERVYDFRETGWQNPILKISSDGTKILFLEKDIYLFDIYKRTLDKLSDSGQILDAVFSPNMDKILYATASKDPLSPYQAQISIMDIQGKNNKNLDLRTNLDKTVWLVDNLNIIADSKEGLFKVNTDSLAKIAFVYQNNFKAENLILSSDEKVLYFLSEGGFYSIVLQTKEY